MKQEIMITKIKEYYQNKVDEFKEIEIHMTDMNKITELMLSIIKVYEENYINEGEGYWLAHIYKNYEYEQISQFVFDKKAKNFKLEKKLSKVFDIEKQIIFSASYSHGAQPLDDETISKIIVKVLDVLEENNFDEDIIKHNTNV
jgi:hypothetical protein